MIVKMMMDSEQEGKDDGDRVSNTMTLSNLRMKFKMCRDG